MNRAAFSIAIAFITTSCLDTGQNRATIPMRVAGTSVTEPVAATNGWSIELREAKAAFGPLYLCAGFQAGSLCETARMEWTDSAVVDALDPTPHEAGSLHGVTGPVRSWMYDLGIVSLLTQQQPVALPSAAELRGNSVVLSGVARKGPHTIPFLFEIPIRQEEATEIGVSIVRKSGSDQFEHDITGAETSLTVRLDPRPWVKDVDFDVLVETSACSVGGPAVVCDGVTERTCSEDGTIDSERDCSASGMDCVRGTGCTNEAQFTPDSQGYRAVRGALVAQERPAFEWDNAP